MSEERAVSVGQVLKVYTVCYCVAYLAYSENSVVGLFFSLTLCKLHGVFPSLDLGSKDQGFGVLGETVNSTDKKNRI